MRKLSLRGHSREVTWPQSWDKLVAESNLLSWLRAFSVAPPCGETRAWIPIWPGSFQGHGYYRILCWLLASSEAKDKLTRAVPMVLFPRFVASPLTEPLALRENQSRILKILVPILMVPITHCVTWGKFLSLSDHLFLYQEKWGSWV